MTTRGPGILLLLLLVSGLVACGQKGPLVLPESPTAEEVTPADTQTEDEEESDQSPR